MSVVGSGSIRQRIFDAAALAVLFQKITNASTASAFSVVSCSVAVVWTRLRLCVPKLVRRAALSYRCDRRLTRERRISLRLG